MVNGAHDVHADDPAFGYRFIADDLNAGGTPVASERRIWRLCSTNSILSVIHRKRVGGRQAGPPVHDDLLERDFTAAVADKKRVTDITEHPTGALCVRLERYHGDRANHPHRVGREPGNQSLRPI